MTESPPPPTAPPMQRSRPAMPIEAIQEADEAASLQAQTELEYLRARQDYARPADGRRRQVRWRRRALLCIVGADATAGLLGALVALALSAGSRGQAAALVGSVCGWPLALTLAGVYERRATGHGSDEFRRVAGAAVALLAVLSTAVLAGVAGPLANSGTVPGTAGIEPMRALALIGVPLAGVFSLVVHAGGRGALWWMRRRGRCRYRVVVVGLERSVAELIRATRRDSRSGLFVVGACMARHDRAQVDGVPVLGPPSAAVDAVRELGADTVLITSWSDVTQDDLRRLSWELEGSGVELLVAPRLSGIAVPRLHIRTVDGSPLVHVDEQEFTGLRRVAKASLDRGLSVLLVLLGSPVLLAVALAVKLTSPGPVLFHQRRVGRNGETFTMHKFRSMYVDAEQRRLTMDDAVDDDVERGPLFKLRDDPRVTSVGRFIRRYSLDELPQLLDVVRGKMSLVGPRPPLAAEVEQYENDVRRRLRVRPGMTGLWQVSGRANLSWDDAVRLDLHYVENWSLTADLAIMIRTVTAVLARDGAY